MVVKFSELSELQVALVVASYHAGYSVESSNWDKLAAEAVAYGCSFNWAGFEYAVLAAAAESAYLKAMILQIDPDATLLELFGLYFKDGRWRNHSFGSRRVAIK